MVHNNFSKIIMYLESDQHIPNTNGKAKELIIAYACIYKYIVVRFYCYMLRNQQCQLCIMMSQVVLFAYRIMLNILRRELRKRIFYQRGYIVILRDLCNAIKKARQNFVA